jgi:hypothetical protein
MGNWWDVYTAPVQQAVSNLQSNVSAAIPEAQEAGRAALSGLSSANEAAGKLAAAETGVIFAPAVAALGSAAIGAKLIGDAWASKPSPSESNAGVSFTKPAATGSATGSKDSSGKSGGAADSNKYGEQKGSVKANWIEPISNRPGFRKTEDLGLDRKTWSLISEGYTPLEAVTMRLQEETKPSIIRELVWQQRQLDANKIEVSSDYHNWAKETGKSVAINPFENEGDRALALMQGTQQESKLQISKSNPSVSDLFADLPDNGKGLDTAGWEGAKTGFTSKYPDFTKSVNWVESARYNPGVYGNLNSNRNYDAWNKARPEAQVKVISTNELLYGTPQSHTVPAIGETTVRGTTNPLSTSTSTSTNSTKSPSSSSSSSPTTKTVKTILPNNTILKDYGGGKILWDKPEYHEYDNVGLGLGKSIGYFGKKAEPRLITKSHIKKYDKSITETLFGSGESHKLVRQKPARGLRGSEWDMLGELGVNRPTKKKTQTALKEDIHYTNSKYSFQSMQKPNASVRKVVVDEIDILMGERRNSRNTQKKRVNKTTKRKQKKGVN